MSKYFILSYQYDLDYGNFIQVRKSFGNLSSLIVFLNSEFPCIDNVNFSDFDVRFVCSDSDDDDDGGCSKVSPPSLFGFKF